jgi:hypothetical protein
METGIDASPFPYGDYPISNPFPSGVRDHLLRIINHLVSPFPYGNPRMERGRETKKFAFGDSP